VCASDLAPNYPDLRALNLTLRPVDKGDLLAEIEAGRFGVIDTLDLDETCVGVGVALSTLIAQVATLDIESVTLFRRHGDCFSLSDSRQGQTSRENATLTCESQMSDVAMVEVDTS